MTQTTIEKAIARGFRFTHDRMLDTGWTPGPGQRYADAPKVECEVTKVTPTTVYYRADSGGFFCLDRADFEKRFVDA
jgi:hypothetical protein